MKIYYNKEFNITLYNANCFDIMKKLENNSIDCILTDPPYNINIDKDKGWDSITDFSSFSYEFGELAKNILKDNGSFYWFGDEKNIAYSQIELDKHFHLLNSLIWQKPSHITMKGCKNIYRAYAPITERILFYSQFYDVDSRNKIHEEGFLEIKKYMRDERRKIKEYYNFKYTSQFNDYVNKITNTRSIVSRHYFENSQWHFATEEIYKLLQTTGFFQKSYKELQKEYKELFDQYTGKKEEYESLRRIWNNDINATDVLKFTTTQGVLKIKTCLINIYTDNYFLSKHSIFS